MNEAKYPLCARAKLHVFKIPPPDADLVSAADVEKMLEGAPEVVAMGNNLTYWSTDQSRRSDDSHTARLIMIEPIVKDTAESLIKSVIDDYRNGVLIGGEWFDRLDRALRLLEGK